MQLTLLFSFFPPSFSLSSSFFFLLFLLLLLVLLSLPSPLSPAELNAKIATNMTGTKNYRLEFILFIIFVTFGICVRYAAVVRRKNGFFGRSSNGVSCNISDATDPVLLMAYYFPQFHDVPENYPEGGNRSWTDWDNIRLALKDPDGSDVFQPMESETLGYYDLTQLAPRRAQGQLAKKYGVDGFIFYHYWFNQGAVMDKPLLLRLKDGHPAGQFYFCWANEDWGMFYGRPREGARVVKYDYNRSRDHAVYLARFMSHPDYVKIGGRPVFSIYRVDYLPLVYMKLLKKELHALGIDVHLQLTTMKSIGGLDKKIEKAGYYDSSMEFAPNLRNQSYIESKSQLTEFRKYIEPSVPFKDIFYGVEVGFDPTARRLSMGTRHTEEIIWKMNPKGVYSQMRVLFDQVYRECAAYNIRHPKLHPKLVSLFAWNEWGEGATLEPTTKYGYQMLEAVQRARKESRVGCERLEESVGKNRKVQGCPRL